jgi:hypothetical protein
MSHGSRMHVKVPLLQSCAKQPDLHHSAHTVHSVLRLKTGVRSKCCPAQPGQEANPRAPVPLSPEFPTPHASFAGCAPKKSCPAPESPLQVEPEPIPAAMPAGPEFAKLQSAAGAIPGSKTGARQANGGGPAPAVNWQALHCLPRVSVSRGPVHNRMKASALNQSHLQEPATANASKNRPKPPRYGLS